MKKILKPLALALLCVGTASLSTGCIGMIAGSVQRSADTDKATYEMVSKQSAIPADHARVWIYTPGGGPSGLNTTGDGTFISFNRQAYFVGGLTFHHRDLPKGEYRVTVDEVGKKKGFKTWLGPGNFQQQISFEGGKEYFIRMQGPKANPAAPGDTLGAVIVQGKKVKYVFEVVPAEEAIAQMRPLTHWIRPQDGTIPYLGVWEEETK